MPALRARGVTAFDCMSLTSRFGAAALLRNQAVDGLQITLGPPRWAFFLRATTNPVKKKHKLAVQVGRLGFLPVSRSIGKTASDAQIIGRSKDKSPRGPDRTLKEDHGALLDSDSLAFALACWCELLSIRASHHALKHLWWTFLGPVGEGRPSNHGDATRHTTKGLYNGTISAT